MGHGGFLSEVRTHSRYLAWLWCQTFCEPITTARSYARFCVTKKGFIFHSPQNACSLPERTASSQMFHDELDRFYFTWGVEGHVNRSKTHVSPTDCAAYIQFYTCYEVKSEAPSLQAVSLIGARNGTTFACGVQETRAVGAHHLRSGRAGAHSSGSAPAAARRHPRGRAGGEEKTSVRRNLGRHTLGGVIKGHHS